MKKSIWMAVAIFIVLVGIFSLVGSVLLATILSDLAHRVLFIVMGAILFLFGFIVGVAIKYQIEVYECTKCGKIFKPTIGAYCAGAHTLMRRYLKCPHCGKKHFAKWKLEQ